MRRLVVVLLLSLCFSTAWAARGDQYWIAQLGIMSIDVNSASPAYSIGTYYGYGLNTYIAVEGELTKTYAGGEYSAVGGDGEFGLWTAAGYGVFRYPVMPRGFVKGKVGLAYENITNSLPVGGELSATSFGIASGLGFGYALRSGFTLEGEISKFDQDILFYSLGTHFAF